MLVLDVFLVPDRASLLFFLPFLGENESRVFLPFVGGGDISTAPRIGDLEYLDLLLDPINPLEVLSYDGDLEKERLPRLLIGDTIRRLRGDGDRGIFFLPLFFDFRRFWDIGDRDFDRDLE